MAHGGDLEADGRASAGTQPQLNLSGLKAIAGVIFLEDQRLSLEYSTVLYLTFFKREPREAARSDSGRLREGPNKERDR